MTDHTFRGYPVTDLQAAFDKVVNPDDRYAPIVAEVSIDELDIVCAAVEYFTRNIPKVLVVDMSCEKFVVFGSRLEPEGDN